jgi:hypothetical protein
MFKLQITSNTRAKGKHVSVGEILTTDAYDIDTLKAINNAGKGRWCHNDEPATETEAPRRGRPKKEEFTGE